jgi:hypothetical protein
LFLTELEYRVYYRLEYRNLTELEYRLEYRNLTELILTELEFRNLRDTLRGSIHPSVSGSAAL